MSEFMGNIEGKYDAKEAGFSPGASSLHSAMAGHGPESGVYKKASDFTPPIN
jgi:homogentisate 1,2-dioxygenase